MKTLTQFINESIKKSTHTLGQYYSWLVGDDKIVDDFNSFDEWNIFGPQIKDKIFKDVKDAWDFFTTYKDSGIKINTEMDDNGEYISTFELEVNGKKHMIETRHSSELPKSFSKLIQAVLRLRPEYRPWRRKQLP